MRSHRLIVLTAVLLALGYMGLRGGFDGLQPALAQAPPASASTKGLATATFAAGCFWCVEADFDKVPGVISTISGYTGGRIANPGYEQVSQGGTGHAEAVEIVYDPAKVPYQNLLDVFWHNIDPFVKNRQV